MFKIPIILAAVETLVMIVNALIEQDEVSFVSLLYQVIIMLTVVAVWLLG